MATLNQWPPGKNEWRRLFSFCQCAAEIIENTPMKSSRPPVPTSELVNTSIAKIASASDSEADANLSSRNLNDARSARTSSQSTPDMYSSVPGQPSTNGMFITPLSKLPYWPSCPPSFESLVEVPVAPIPSPETSVNAVFAKVA